MWTSEKMTGGKQNGDGTETERKEKLLDFPLFCEYNGNDVFTVLSTRMRIRRRCAEYENDISA